MSRQLSLTVSLISLDLASIKCAGLVNIYRLLTVRIPVLETPLIHGPIIINQLPLPMRQTIFPLPVIIRRIIKEVIHIKLCPCPLRKMLLPYLTIQLTIRVINFLDSGIELNSLLDFDRKCLQRRVVVVFCVVFDIVLESSEFLVDATVVAVGLAHFVINVLLDFLKIYSTLLLKSKQ